MAVQVMVLVVNGCRGWGDQVVAEAAGQWPRRPTRLFYHAVYTLEGGVGPFLGWLGPKFGLQAATSSVLGPLIASSLASSMKDV